MELPQCFGTGWYEVRHHYLPCFDRFKRSARECQRCELKPDCYEARNLLARERGR